MTDSYLLPPLPFQDKYKIYYYYEDGEVCTADPELVKQLEKEKSLETVDEQPKSKQTEYEEHNNNGLKKSTSHPFKYLRNRGNNHRKTVSENPTFFKPSASPLTTSSPSPSSSSSSNASPTTSLSIPQSQFDQSSSYKTTANDLPQSTSIHHHKHTFSTPAAIHNASTMKRGRSKSFYQFFTGGVSNDLPEDSEQQPQTPRVKFATFRHPKEEEEQAEDESEEDDEEEEEEFEEEIDYQQENANQSLQQTTTKSAKKNKLKKSLKKKINKISLSGDSNKKLASESNKKNFTSYRYDDVQSREEPITKLSPEQQAIEDQRMKNQLLHIEKLLEKQHHHQKTLNSSNITNRNSEITENSSLDSLPSSTTWATSVSSSSPPPSSNKQEESFHFKQQRSLSLSAQAAAAATPRRNSHRRVPSQTHQEIQAQLQQIQEVYGSDQTKTYNTPASAAATARRVSIGNGNCYAFSEPHHNLSQESIIYNNQQQQHHPIFAPEYSMTNTLKSNNDKLNLCSPRTETPPNFSFNSSSSSKHQQQQSNKFGKFLFRKENVKEENNNNNNNVSSGSGYFGSQNETLQPQFSYQSNKDSSSLPSPTNVSPGSLHTAKFASINAFPSPRAHGSNSSGSSVQMYFTQDPSAVLDMETITDTNTAVNTLITTTSAGAVARRSSLVSSPSNSSVAASPTAVATTITANSTPRTSSGHGHHKSISIARPRNSVTSPVCPSSNVSSSLSNQQHHHHYNLLHAASPKNFFNKEFETRHQSFSVPAKSKAISSASKHGRCMSKSIAEVAMASTSLATPATKPLPLPASTFSSFAFQGSSSSIGHGLGIQAFGGDSSTIEEAPTTVAATTSSVVTNGNSESNFSTSTVASSIVSTISPNNSPSMSRPRQQSVSFSTSGTFNDDYQVSQVPIKFNDDSDFNEEDDDEEEEDDDDEESNIEDGFDIINHHNYVNRVSPPAMGFPVTPPHSGTSPEFKSSFGYNNNSQPSEIINPGPRRHSIFTPSYNDQTQYMARHENLYNVSTPKTPKQVKFKGHDDDDEDDHNNNNNNIVTTPNHRRRQSVFTTNTLSETHNHHHHHHDDYDTASSSSQRSSLQDSHDSSATSTDDEIVGATTTFHKKEEQQEEESEEEKHLVVTPISPRNSLPENLRKLVSMNHAPFASIPQDQKLLLFGLYLQGCYGDFPGWRRVPTAHWKTHFVAGKVDAIAVNAEKWWKENQGMNPDVALNRFKSQLLAYV